VCALGPDPGPNAVSRSLHRKVGETVVGVRPWAKKKKREDQPPPSRAPLDEVDRMLIQKLNADEDKDDDVLQFLKSLAPKIREVPSSQRLDLQLEMMQCVNRYVKKCNAPASAAYVPQPSAYHPNPHHQVQQQVPAAPQVNNEAMWHPTYTNLG